jgi:hypothetical protein
VPSKLSRGKLYGLENLNLKIDLLNQPNGGCLDCRASGALKTYWPPCRKKGGTRLCYAFALLNMELQRTMSNHQSIFHDKIEKKPRIHCSSYEEDEALGFIL